MKSEIHFNDMLSLAELRACQTATFNVVQTALIHNTPIAVGSAGKVILLDARTLNQQYGFTLHENFSNSST